MKIKSTWFGVLTSILIVASVEANDTFSACCDLPSDSAFQKGNWELGVNSGLMFSPFLASPQKYTLDYTTSGIQAGYMLSNPGSSGWRRGNWEVLTELFGGGVIDGRGSYIVGGTLWFRYNFLPTNGRLLPYAQLGGGGETTDIDNRILGQAVNFNVNGAVGLRYMITTRCSLNLEGRYEHYSDAGMTKVNRGINAGGVVMGVSWFF